MHEYGIVYCICDRNQLQTTEQQLLAFGTRLHQFGIAIM